jgi:DNA-binding NtrC family response regulator
MSGAPRQGRAADLSALRSALDCVAEAVVIVDSGGCVEFANELARGRFRLSPGERVGLPDTDPLTWLSWVPGRRVRQVGDREGMHRTIFVAPVDRVPVDESSVRLSGTSLQTTRLVAAIAAASETTEPVLVSGEPGTGKESVARAIHEAARFAPAAFESVSSKTLSVSALERRLDGRGSLGPIGTLFLEDVENMTRSVQRRLAQAFAAGEVHVRVMASTQSDIEASVESGVFDRELFFRLNAIPIHVSPLRDRPGDVASLSAAIIARCNAASNRRRVDRISPEASDALSTYPFPGNARELEAVVERSWSRCRGRHIRLDHLPESITRPTRRSRRAPAERGDADSLEVIEREFLLRVLADNDWRLGAVAKELSVSRTTLWRRLSRLKIENPRRKPR